METLPYHSTEQLRSLSLTELHALWELVPTDRQRSYKAAYEREIRTAGAVGSDELERQVAAELLKRYDEAALVPIGSRWARSPGRVQEAARQNVVLDAPEDEDKPTSGKPSPKVMIAVGLAALLFVGLMFTRLLGGRSSGEAEVTPEVSPTPTPYKEAPADWEKPMTKFLHELDPFGNGWEAHLYQEVKRFVLELEATRAHDPNKITAETVYSYGIPTIELVNEAQKILQNTKPENENREIAASHAADTLSTALVRAGLLDWRVELKNPMNARMMVRSVEKKVFVREDALFSRDSVKRLLVHEIGTHVFRYINGERQQL